MEKILKMEVIKPKVYELMDDSRPTEYLEDEIIIVRMNHKMLDEMLKALSKKKALMVGVACKRVR
jgi:hypothetical protein